MGDRIGVPLELEGFEVGDCEVVDGMLEVQVASTLRAACYHCGSLEVVTHAANTRRIRDRACGHPVVLLWAQRRFACSDCERTCRERHPEVAGRRSVTKRFRRALFEASCDQPMTHGLSQLRIHGSKLPIASDRKSEGEAPAILSEPDLVQRDFMVR